MQHYNQSINMFKMAAFWKKIFALKFTCSFFCERSLQSIALEANICNVSLK